MSGLRYEGAYLGYGDANRPESQSTPQEGSGLTNILEQYAPVVAAYISPQDAREQAEVIKAKIANLKRMRETFPFARVLYDNQIAKLKARLKVVQQQAVETQEGVEATRMWRTVGQGAVGIGMLAGLAFVALVAVTTIKIAKSNPQRRRRARRG